MNKDDILDFFDDVFSKEEIDIFKNIKPLNLNIDELSKKGTIKETVLEENGLVQTQYEFTSFDGKVNFIHTSSHYKIDEKSIKLADINDRIKQAVENEDFILAAQLKKEKEHLL